MELTPFGLAFLPLCALALVQPIWLLYLVLLAGVFGAATPLVIAGYGLPPQVTPAALFLAYAALQFLLGTRFVAALPAWRTLEPFVLTASYALVTALLVPRLFAGDFTVWPQKLTPPFDIPVPLGPSMSNVTQSSYLLIEGALLVGAGLYLTRARIDFVHLLQGYLVCGYVVVAICVWQVVHKLTGLWYPEAFLYSNPGWVIFPGQTMGIVPRINGPFSEPAALAYYLSGTVFCCTWLMLRGHRNRLAAVLLPLAVLALISSTSTTGFAVLGAGGVGLVIYGMSRAPRRMALRIFAFAVPAAVLAVVAALAVATLSEKIEESVAMVMHQSLQKAEGESFATRTGLDLDSLGVLFPSYGLGAGWGSVRASSLIPGLLANLGIFGCMLLLWFVVRLVRQVGRARRLASTAGQLMVLDGASAVVIGNLTAAVLSAPSLNAVDFYLMLGLLIACAARVEYEATSRRAQARRLQLAPAPAAVPPVADAAMGR